MLPIIEQDATERVISNIMNDIDGWRKEMIHVVKDENPEINAAIVQIAQNSSLDPKAVATGAYMTYLLLQDAFENGTAQISFEDDEE